ncbi:MAG: type III pantothenate kinase [Alphaproteobacteria bacterium]|nr:type III pantothenate kinase [Alphaproteobacteria bacterium]
MLIVLDIGNTHLVAAVFDGEMLVGHGRLSTHPERTADEWMVSLTQLFQLHQWDIAAITGAALASVVPSVGAVMKEMCRPLFQCEPVIVGAQGVALGIEVVVDNPKEVGADRVVNALAAFTLYGPNLIIVDFGTATTFDVVDEGGRYVGGVIAPGINLSMKALHMATAQLPAIDVKKTDKVVGTNTVDAMRSGVYHGYRHAIEGICAQIKTEMGHPSMKVIATGGLAFLFADATPVIDRVEPYLTLYGLKQIYELNQ